MIIIPAVDIKGGKCVRLVEGVDGTETTFGNDPAEWAQKWTSQGAEYLHVVDLDGAFEGAPRNFDKVTEIIETAGVPVEFGGGVRSAAVVNALLEAGADRVVIGSALVDDRPWADSIFHTHPGNIAAGLDAREGKIAVHGWKDLTDVDAFDLARECQAAGAACIIYTDISRDGRMAGANLTAMREMVETVDIPVVASGGVTTIDDVLMLAAAGCAACIIGRALYDEKISLPEAIEAANLA